jgi:hypothetical protein
MRVVRWLGPVLLAVATGVVACVPLTALGATPGTATGKALHLETSPLPINLVVEPGKTVTTEIRIKQGTAETEKLKIQLMKFAAFGEEGKPSIMERQPGDDYFDWVNFDRPVFDAPPNVWQTIKVTIKVPKTAAFGYYYAVVFSRVGDDANAKGGTTALAAGTAVLILLDAHVPNAKRDVELLELKSEHRVYEFLPAKFTVKFKNKGNVHVVPHGNLFIQSRGKTVATLGLNGASGNILPNSNRIFGLQWRDGWPHVEDVVEDGKSKVVNNKQVSHLVWNNGETDQNGVPINQGAPPHPRFGKYTAHLFAVYDNGGRDVPIEATIDFWVIPWRFLLVVLAVLLLCGFGVYAAVSGVFRQASRLGNRGRRR